MASEILDMVSRDSYDYLDYIRNKVNIAHYGSFCVEGLGGVG